MEGMPSTRNERNRPIALDGRLFYGVTKNGCRLRRGVTDYGSATEQSSKQNNVC